MRSTPLRRRLPRVGDKLIDSFDLRLVEVIEIHTTRENGGKGGKPGLPLLYVRDLNGRTYGRCSIYFSDLAEAA